MHASFVTTTLSIVHRKSERCFRVGEPVNSTRLSVNLKQKSYFEKLGYFL